MEASLPFGPVFLAQMFTGSDATFRFISFISVRNKLAGFCGSDSINVVWIIFLNFYSRSGNFPRCGRGAEEKTGR